MVEVNEEQMETLNGELRFVTMVSNDPGCSGCAVDRRSEGLPCSPGTRRDGKSGIWVRRPK